MNIFALSKDPVESAQQMLNKHVVKMPTETCQMLHTNALFIEYTDRHGQEPTLRQLKEYHALMGSKLMKPYVKSPFNYLGETKYSQYIMVV